MPSNYFQSLKQRAHEFEDGLDALCKTWDWPLVLRGRCERTEETNCHLELIQNAVRTKQAEINEFMADIKEFYTEDKSECKSENSSLNSTESNSLQTNSEQSDRVEQFLQKIDEEYNMLEHMTNELYDVFVDYGYQYDKDETLEPLTSQIKMEKDIEFEQNKPEKIERFVECIQDISTNLEDIEFTPDLSWKRRIKGNKKLINNKSFPRAIATPVITKVGKVPKLVNFDECENELYTPVRMCSQDPIVSKQFCIVFKNE